MAGLSDFLFNGATPTPAPTSSDTSTAFPLWLQDAIFNTIGAATNVAGQDYTAFPGPTVAAPSADTQASWDAVKQNQGVYQPYLQQAGALTSAATAPSTVAAADPSLFLNPMQDYITGALNRNLTEKILPSVQNEFVAAGQSRSPQEQEIASRGARDTQNAVGEALAQNYTGALNAAISSRGQDIGQEQQQRQLDQTAGAQFGLLGTSASQLGAADVGQLSAVGQAQDTQNQANLNAALQQFQNQQQYPYQNVSFLSDIIRGLPVQAAGSTTQTSGTTYPATTGASPLSAFLGGSGLLKSLGYAKGGSVSDSLHRRRVARHLSHAVGAIARLRAEAA